jgi:hypothetical protein
MRPLLAAALLLWLGAASAEAHHRPGDAPVQGLAIAGLTHGEVAIVAAHRAKILALAERQGRTDPTFRRLWNYANIQRAYCLWGLVPGSLADEESPFNGCSHAFASALKALLLHMQGMPDTPAAARALAERIAGEVRADPAAAAPCGYSGDTFDTAEIVQPLWRDVPGHPASLLTFAGAALAILAGLALAWRAAAGVQQPGGIGRAG